MATRKKTPKAKPAKRVDRRKTTSTRITPETRAKLEATAAQSGRSLAQEIEFRLEQSFEEDEAFGGRQLRALFTLFGGAAVLIEKGSLQAKLNLLGQGSARVCGGSLELCASLRGYPGARRLAPIHPLGPFGLQCSLRRGHVAAFCLKRLATIPETA